MATINTATTATKKNSPFKATRMWNQLLSSFKEGMELKRKRYRLKSYEQCFSGAEALDWIHSYIQNHPSFGAHVTREQAFMLLQKFIENDVFQNAVGKVTKKFQDTNCLYKFSDSDISSQNEDDNQTTGKENIASQGSLSNLLKNFRRNSRHVSNDVEQTPAGKSADLKNPPVKHIGMKHSRISNSNSNSNMTPLALDMNNISLMSIKKGCHYNDMSTIMLDNDDEDDVFNTSVSQNYFMRSNSLRVNKTTHQSNKLDFNSFLDGQCEDDILYSSNINEKPLPSKQPIMKNIRKKVVLRKFTSIKSSPKSQVSTHKPTIMTTRKRRSEEKLCLSPNKKTKKIELPQAAMSSVLPRKAISLLGENASFINEVDSYNTYEVNNLPGYRTKSKPKSSNSTVTSKSETLSTIKKLPKQKLFISKSESIKTLNKIRLSPEQQKKSRKLLTHPMKRRSLSQNNLNLKTKSLSVYNLNEQPSLKKPLYHSSTQDLASGSLYKAPSTWSINTIGLPANDFKNKTCDITTIDIEDTWKSVVLLSLKKLLATDDITTCLNAHEVEGKSIMKNVNWKTSEITRDAPDWLLSAMNCLSNWPVRNGNINDSVLQDLPNYPGFERDVYRAIKEHYHSLLIESLIPSHMYPLLEQCSEQLHGNIDKSIRLLQHIILLLPCWNCRQLQLLINFMNKLAANERLEISRDLLNKDLVLHSFFRLIIRRDKYSMMSAKYEDAVSIRVTMFLMEHYDTVFKPPPNIRFQVDHKLAVTLGAPSFSKKISGEKKYGSQYFARPSSAGDKPKTLRKQTSYCVQISKEEYEREAKEMSNKAIKDLLTQVMTDNNMGEKERNKRLKQFQKAYPEVYAQQFPHDDLSNCSSISSRSSNMLNTRFKLASKPSFLVEKLL